MCKQQSLRKHNKKILRTDLYDSRQAPPNMILSISSAIDLTASTPYISPYLNWDLNHSSDNKPIKITINLPLVENNKVPWWVTDKAAWQAFAVNAVFYTYELP